MALYRWSRPRVVNLLLENLYPSSPALPGVQGRATEPASFPRLIPSLVPNTWMRIPRRGVVSHPLLGTGTWKAVR